MSFENKTTKELEAELDKMNWYYYVAIEEQDPGLDYEKIINIIEAELKRRKNETVCVN